MTLRLLLTSAAFAASTCLSACSQEATQPASAESSRPGDSGALQPAAPGMVSPEAGLPPGHPPIEAGAQGGMMGGIPSLPQSAANVTGTTLSVAGAAFDVPEGWTQETPANTLRLAQYSLPGDAGPAELTVTAFGVGQGGDVQGNIQRWASAFSGEGGAAAVPETETREAGGLTITVVRVQGTYTPSPMMGGGPPQENSGLHGLIVEGGPQGTIFVKVVGPSATLADHAEELEAFTASARLAD